MSNVFRRFAFVVPLSVVAFSLAWLLNNALHLVDTSAFSSLQADAATEFDESEEAAALGEHAKEHTLVHDFGGYDYNIHALEGVVRVECRDRDGFATYEIFSRHPLGTWQFDRFDGRPCSPDEKDAESLRQLAEKVWEKVKYEFPESLQSAWKEMFINRFIAFLMGL